MENKVKKEQERIFKSYQRMLLLELYKMQEALRNGEKMTAEEVLSRLIANTEAAFDD